MSVRVEKENAYSGYDVGIHTFIDVAKEKEGFLVSFMGIRSLKRIPVRS